MKAGSHSIFHQDWTAQAAGETVRLAHPQAAGICANQHNPLRRVFGNTKVPKYKRIPTPFAPAILFLEFHPKIYLQKCQIYAFNLSHCSIVCKCRTGTDTNTHGWGAANKPQFPWRWNSVRPWRMRTVSLGQQRTKAEIHYMEKARCRAVCLGVPPVTK